MMDEAYKVTFPLTPIQLAELRALPPKAHIRIERQEIQDDDLSCLMGALRNDTDTLSFYETHLFNCSITAFRTFVEHLPVDLKMLDITFGNELNENIADKLILLMQNLPESVDYLVLNGNGLYRLDETELQTFAQAIPNTIRTLSIEFSQLDELDFFKLIEHLPATIRELYIADNGLFDFDPENLKNLFDILPRDIQKVDLSEEVDLSDIDFTPHIAEILEKNPRLRSKEIWLNGQNLLAQTATPAVTVLGKRSRLFSNPPQNEHDDDEDATPARQCPKK
tara:strand:- start:167 stop:1006 length:840 start_codon:yes stop_codon:yes gene_type:complete